ncbi:MAG: Ig-like domain-containing protein [Lachnospiraceae bacterium]|nr:Ig-like domain-containing protein [Lachnospiraceae bacterium]
MRKKFKSVILSGIMGLMVGAVCLMPGNALHAKAEILGDGAGREAYVLHNNIQIPSNVSSYRNVEGSYNASTPKVITFMDNKNQINVAYLDGYNLVIQKYDPATIKANDANAVKMVQKITLAARYPIFGNVTCDSDGNYYAVWGQNDTGKKNIVTLCIAKYDSDGKFIKELALKGFDTRPYSDEKWGTMEPFHAGNCSIAVSNGVVAVNYARLMYSGHQSNMIVYAKCDTMERIEGGSTAYTSHSFDQRIMATSNGGFLALNQGDAYSRGFCVTEIASHLGRAGELTSFNFREGANREYGYNETFALMGNAAELKNGYVFTSSSERELSLAPAPSSGYYGHNDARDLFIQIFNKEFKFDVDYAYLVAGETRRPTGTKPSNPKTSLWLTGNEVNKGILWLTKYDKNHFAANPKVVTIDDNTVGIFWEKREYGNKKQKEVKTYYAELDGIGNPKMNTIQVPNTLLASDTDPVYYNGKIYWATKDEYGVKLQAIYTGKYNNGTWVWPKGIGLSLDSAKLKPGDKRQLTAVVVPSDTFDNTVKWTSSNPNIVSVDENGLMEAKVAGEAVVTAETINGLKHECKVTVMKMPNGIGIDLDSLLLEKGTSRQLKAIVVPADAYDKSVKWTTSDANIATVDANGVVTGKGLGKATITATTVNGLSHNCEVTVGIMPSGIRFDYAPTVIEVGQGVKYQVSILPENATERTLKWTVSDPSIATVVGEENGLGGVVKFKKAGKVTLTAATVNNLKTTVEITALADATPGNIFADVSMSTWEYNTAKFVYDKGYMTGKGELLPGRIIFAPHDNLKRCEFVQVLYSLDGKPEVEGESGFEDVKSSAWYAKAVTWAKQKGITGGKTATKFDPEGYVTREEQAVMLAKYAEYKGCKTMGTIDKRIGSFYDGNQVSSWAVDAMNWAISNGIISGTGSGMLCPQDPAWRIHCAAMISTFKKNVMPDVTLPVIDLPEFEDTDFDDSEEETILDEDSKIVNEEEQEIDPEIE